MRMLTCFQLKATHTLSVCKIVSKYLVCSCWGVRSQQGNWCFQVCYGCSHPEEAVQSESLCVLALGQEEGLKEQQFKTNTLGKSQTTKNTFWLKRVSGLLKF